MGVTRISRSESVFRSAGGTRSQVLVRREQSIEVNAIVSWSIVA